MWSIEERNVEKGEKRNVEKGRTTQCGISKNNVMKKREEPRNGEHGRTT